MIAPSIIIAVPLLSLLAVATTTDLVDRRIPNGVSLGGAVLGLLVQAAVAGWSGVALGGVGWICCLALFLPLYAIGGTAAGDVKLIAMVGAFLGPLDGLFAGLLALVAGGAVAAVALSANVLVQSVDDVQLVSEARTVDPRASRRRDGYLRKIPYAAAIALGAAAAVLQPEWLMELLPARGLS